MYKELLPIGTVVLLKGGRKKLMIIGVQIAKKDNPERVYDYMAVLYPEGFLGMDRGFLFDTEDINDVVFKGYSNPERDDFLEFMDNFNIDDFKDENGNFIVP